MWRSGIVLLRDLRLPAGGPFLGLLREKGQAAVADVDDRRRHGPALAAQLHVQAHVLRGKPRVEALGGGREGRLGAALVEPQVGDLEQEVGALAVVRIGGDAVVEIQRRPAAGRERHRPDPFAHAFDDGERGDHVGVRQDQNELVASPPAARVDRAQRLADDARRAHEHAVAHGVPEAVVDRLEALQIHHHRREDPLGSLGAGDLPGEMVDEEPPVVEAGQRIRDRVDAQHRQIRFGHEARLLQQALLAVEVMEEHGLEAERRAQLLSQGRKHALDLVPVVRRIVRLERDPGPIGQELAQDVGALAVESERRQQLLKPGQRKVALTALPRKPADVHVEVFPRQSHSPPVPARPLSLVARDRDRLFP